MVVKECIICGKEFDARGRAKCCSPKCSKINKRESDRKWREANPEKAREFSRKWREANPEKARESSRKSSKKWREDNPEYCKQYYQDNRERKREYTAQWLADNPGYYTQWYQDNREYKLECDAQYKQKKISELNEQYNGDLYSMLEKCPSRWEEREAKMLVWFGESYYDGIVAKIKSTPVCEVTGESNDLVIHHLYSFNTHPELGNDLANMVRVTKAVHNEFHKKYGYGDNTPEQWMEFIKDY